MGKFTDTIKDLSAPITTGLGLMLEGHEDRRQVRQQEKLQKLQIAGQKEIADYNKSNQLDIWNKTNYEAQVEHLKNAGLNPALLYGQGGAGGTLGQGGASGVSGASASQGGGNEMGMALQLGLMKAQKENIEADTDKKRAEAGNLDTNTNLQGSQIISEKLKQEFQTIQNKIANETMDDAISTIAWNAQKMLYEQNIAGRNSEVKNATYNEEIEQIKTQSQIMLLEKAFKQQGIFKTQEEIKQIQEQIKQGWRKLELENQGQEVSIENTETMAQAILKSAGLNAGANVINGIVKLSTLGGKK